MKYVLSLFLVFLPLSVFAEGDNEKEKNYSIEAEFGMLIASGNTDSTATNAKLDVKQDFTNWKNNYIFEAFYKEDDVSYDNAGVEVTESQTTADKFFASIQSDYKLDSEHKGIFAYASYEDDKFSGFASQATIAVGYSDRLFETEKSHLDYSVGPGLAIAKTEALYDENDVLIPSVKTETFAVRMSGSYLYKISENAKFTQKISSDIAGDSDKNTKIKSETGLTATINGSMALKLAYTIHQNTKPPVDKEKMDSVTSVTLVFTY